MSSAFPAKELQYIMSQSQASMLITSSMFAAKGRETLSIEAKLEPHPRHLQLEKLSSSSHRELVSLVGDEAGDAGMMLYTSGTTNRPVRCWHSSDCYWRHATDL